MSPLTSWLGFLNVPKYFGVGATAVVAGAGVVGGTGVVATIIKDNFLDSRVKGIYYDL